MSGDRGRSPLEELKYAVYQEFGVKPEDIGPAPKPFINSAAVQREMQKALRKVAEQVEREILYGRPPSTAASASSSFTGLRAILSGGDGGSKTSQMYAAAGAKAYGVVTTVAVPKGSPRADWHMMSLGCGRVVVLDGPDAGEVR